MALLRGIAAGKGIGPAVCGMWLGPTSWEPTIPPGAEGMSELQALPSCCPRKLLWLEWPSQSLTCALLQQNTGNKKETARLLHGQNIQLLQAQVEVADMDSHGHRDGNSIRIQLSLRPAET